MKINVLGGDSTMKEIIDLNIRALSVDMPLTITLSHDEKGVIINYNIRFYSDIVKKYNDEFLTVLYGRRTGCIHTIQLKKQSSCSSDNINMIFNKKLLKNKDTVYMHQRYNRNITIGKEILTKIVESNIDNLKEKLNI